MSEDSIQADSSGSVPSPERQTAMELFLRSVGYVHRGGGMWQDKRKYEPEKTLEDAYKFETGMFR